MINLKKFNIIHGFVPDHMHIVAGVSKQFANMWFGSSIVPGSFLEKRQVDEVNNILDAIKAPHQIG